MRYFLPILLLMLFACSSSQDDKGDKGGGTPPAPAPTPSPQPPTPPPPSVPSTPADEVGDLINTERAKRALPPVLRDAQLTCAASKHAADIGTSRVCSHTGNDGSNFAERARRCGFFLQGGGEIIACGQQTATEAVSAWLNSPPHRDIMLNAEQRQMGIGMYQNFWVVVFAQ